MKSDEIQSLFATAIETYAPVKGEPSDPDISTLRETLTALLLPIAYNGEKGIHNLVELIMNEDDYKMRYGATSRRPPGQQFTTLIFLLTQPMPCGPGARPPTQPERRTTDYSPPPSASPPSSF